MNSRRRLAVTIAGISAAVLAVTFSVAAWAAGPIDRTGGREAAQRELSKLKYRQNEDPLLLRLFNDFMDWLERLFDRAQQGSPGPAWALVAIAVVVIALVALLIWRFGLPARGARKATEPILKLGSDTATGHQRRADAFAAQGRYAEAVRERLRGIVRGLEERGLLDPRPGRTVTEIVAVVRRRLPDAADQLRHGGDVFSDIWYGGRSATADDDVLLRQVSETVAATKPSAGADDQGVNGWTMPGTEPAEPTEPTESAGALAGTASSGGNSDESSPGGGR